MSIVRHVFSVAACNTINSNRASYATTMRTTVSTTTRINCTGIIIPPNVCVIKRLRFRNRYVTVRNYST